MSLEAQRSRSPVLETGVEKKLVLSTLHVHPEGSLSLQPLKDVANDLHIQVDAKVWEVFESQMTIDPEDPDKTLLKFILALGTPAMRFLVMAGIEQGLEGKAVVKAIYQKCLDFYYDNGYRVVDLLISPHALAKEGNLDQRWIQQLVDYPIEKTKLALLPGYNTEAGKKVYDDWKNIDPGKIPGAADCLQALNEVIREDPRFARMNQHNTQNPDPNIMVVGVRVALRRDSDFEVNLKNGNWKFIDGRIIPPDIMYDLFRAYQNGWIDGFDMAGDEGKISLKEFSFLFFEAKRRGMPTTTHAGERKPDVDDPYQDIFWALMLDVERIGHGVRMFDDNELAQILLAEAIKRNKVVDVNLTSNLWTGIVPKDLAEHPFIKFLRRIIDNPNAVVYDMDGKPQYLRDLRYVICDDDPHITGTVDQELLKLADLLPENQKTIQLKNIIDQAYKIAAEFPRRNLWKIGLPNPTMAHGITYQQQHDALEQLYVLFNRRAEYNKVFKKPNRSLAQVWRTNIFRKPIEQEQLQIWHHAA